MLECSIKRSSSEDKKVKQGCEGRGIETEERDTKERKAREKARSRRYSSWTRDTSLYPHSATSWLKQLLLQLSLANPAFRAVSRTPLGDFGDELLVYITHERPRVSFRAQHLDFFLFHLPSSSVSIRNSKFENSFDIHFSSREKNNRPDNKPKSESDRWDFRFGACPHRCFRSAPRPLWKFRNGERIVVPISGMSLTG